MIQDPSAENDVHLDPMVAIGQFSQHLITVGDVVEFDEILGEEEYKFNDKSPVNLEAQDIDPSFGELSGLMSPADSSELLS